ncbi:MAG: dihydrolipoyl dehydrogenase [Bacteroidia bacterium]|nr:MAG: dihydrolipoyl dehydrogenase [Bacteroidia bacterium]
MEQFDIIVIGSGPGGYISAIRASQLGFKVAIVEKYSSLGGTCLNVGCIPSKALLDSSEHFYNAVHHFEAHGIKVKDVKPDIKQMIERKRKVVKENSDGVAYLMKKNKVTVFNGIGSFLSPQKIKVTNDKEVKELTAKYFIIATGSKPSTLPGIEIDKKQIITSTEALELETIPKHLIVIGGGVIGLELGSVFARLGSKVSVVEFLDRIIPSMDGALSKELQRLLKKNLGFEFYLQHKVLSASKKGKEVVVSAQNKNGETIELKGDYVLVAVGRRPYTEGLGLENAGVQVDEKGRVVVNEKLQTSQPHIYAIGDVIRGPMLAHKAEEEGVFVAEVISGQKPHIDYNLIPGVVYTWPEVASVGLTEEQLKEKNIPYKAGQFPFKASGRAKASMDTDGFIKVLAHKDTDEILGVHMIAPRAADLIAEAVVAMEYKATAEDIGRICHPHPTFSEAFKEACLDAFEKRPLNF